MCFDVCACTRVCCTRVDVRAAQGSGVHVSHGVLCINRHRPVDGSHHLQDTTQLCRSPGHGVRIH